MEESEPYLQTYETTPVDPFTIEFIKTHEDAILPRQAHKNDTGLDLFSVEDVIIYGGYSAVVEVGIQVGYISPGWWFRIEPRSGLGFKHNIQPHLGVIDNGYRGSLGVKLYNFGDQRVEIQKGQAIAQIAFYKLHIPGTISWTDKVHETARGDKGFGSTDKN